MVVCMTLIGRVWNCPWSNKDLRFCPYLNYKHVIDLGQANLLCVIIISHICPGWCGSVDWALACEPESLVQFPVSIYGWVVSQVPSRGHMRGNHILMFLCFSFSLPFPSLKINKIFQKIKLKNNTVLKNLCDVCGFSQLLKFCNSFYHLSF